MVVNDVGDGLHVVAAGPVPPNPSEMLSNARVAARSSPTWRRATST